LAAVGDHHTFFHQSLYRKGMLNRRALFLLLLVVTALESGAGARLHNNTNTDTVSVSATFTLTDLPTATPRRTRSRTRSAPVSKSISENSPTLSTTFTAVESESETSSRSVLPSTSHTDSRTLAPSATASDSGASLSESPTDDDTRTSSITASSAVSPTHSVAESVSVSATEAGAKWLCRSVKLTATVQIISPSLGAPVQSGNDNAVVRTTEDVIRSTGVVAAVNITSCHTFFLDLPEMKPVIISNASASTPPDDVLELLMAGDTGQVVASAGKGLGSLARLAEQNPGLLTFRAETARGGVLQIGPDPLYGTVVEERSVVELDGNAYLLPPAAQNIRFHLSVLPEAPPAPIAERKAAAGMAYAASVVAILVGTAQTPMIAGRIGSVQTAADCPVAISASTELRADQNLLGLPFGSEKRLSYVVGGAVFNPVLGFGVAAGCCMVVAAAAFVTGRTIEETMAVARFPGILAPMFMFMFQGTVYTAGLTLGGSTAFVSTFFGFAALMTVTLFWALVFLVTRPFGVFDELALRSGAETGAFPVHPVVKLFFTSGEWIDRNTPFVGPMGDLFKEYLPQRQWFLSVEIALSFFLGLVESSNPQTATGCVVANVFQALGFWLHLVLVIGAHPYAALPSFILTIAVSLCLLVASIVTAAVPLAGTEGRVDSINAVDGILLAAASFALLKNINDIAAMIYRLVFRGERMRRCREWQRVQIRQMRTALAAKRRDDQITRVLDAPPLPFNRTILENSITAVEGGSAPTVDPEADGDVDSLLDDSSSGGSPTSALGASARWSAGKGPDTYDERHPERGVSIRLLRRLAHYDDRRALVIRPSSLVNKTAATASRHRPRGEEAGVAVSNRGGNAPPPSSGSPLQQLRRRFLRSGSSSEHSDGRSRARGEEDSVPVRQNQCERSRSGSQRRSDSLDTAALEQRAADDEVIYQRTGMTRAELLASL
jgi:hypothetical protein